MGSIALYNNGGGTLTTVTQVGGAAFTLNSMQLANFSRRSGFGQGAAITFTGTKGGGGTVTSSLSLLAGDEHQTKIVTDFTNVTQVSWNQASPYHQFDNIVINAVPSPRLWLCSDSGRSA